MPMPPPRLRSGPLLPAAFLRPAAPLPASRSQVRYEPLPAHRTRTLPGRLLHDRERHPGGGTTSTRRCRQLAGGSRSDREGGIAFTPGVKCPGCPPGFRPLCSLCFLSLDHGGSDDGGRDEFVEFRRTNSSNSASRAFSAAFSACARRQLHLGADDN
jgi:hypothetical protein